MVDGRVHHDVQLAPVLQDAGDDPSGHRTAVNDQSHLLVWDTSTVVSACGVEHRESQGASLSLPAVKHRPGQDVVEEAAETRPPRARQACKGRVGGRSDRDVVRVARDAVWTKRRDNVRELFVKDSGDPLRELFRGHLSDPAVGEAEPIVAVGLATNGTPSGFTFTAPNTAQCLWGGTKPLADVTGLPVRGVDQHEPEADLGRVESDGAGP